MAEKRRGLGRGLGSLIPSSPAGESEEQSVENTPGANGEGESSGAVSRETGGVGSTEAPKTSASFKKSGATRSGDTDKGTGNSSGAKSGKAAASETRGQSENSRTGIKKSTSTSAKTSPRQSSSDASNKSSEVTKKNTSASEAKGQSSEKSADSGGPSGSDGRARTTRKATTPRADMGAALRKSAGGRRPVDFFFQPSESSSVDAAVPTSAPDEQRESLKSGERTNAATAVPGDNDSPASEEGTQSRTNTSVSRETVQGSADPSPRDQQEGAEGGEAEGSTLIPVPGAHFGEIPVSDIHPNRKQPRQEFDEDEMEELVHSIREIGLLQPIVIRPSQEEGDAKYELVMGERRWRATQRAGLETIPAIVRQTQDVDLLRDALLENLHRSQLNPLEEAAAYQQLLNEFGTTQDELALKIGRSRPQISNTIRLLRLPALVQRRVAAGILSAGHARALLALTDPAAMERLAQRIVAEGLSVRSVEEIIQSGAAEKGEQKPRKPATPNKHHERLDYIADAFSDKLDTNVKINLGARKGKMTIEFASVDDLNRIITVLDPKIEGE